MEKEIMFIENHFSFKIQQVYKGDAIVPLVSSFQ